LRILLDNSVPLPLRHFLADHVVVAAVDLNWERLKNGKLLVAAEEEATANCIKASIGVWQSSAAICRCP